MRIYYTLIDSKQCYFTLKTVNFTSMEVDRGRKDKYTIVYACIMTVYVCVLLDALSVDILLGIANTLTNICPSIIVQEQKLTKYVSLDLLMSKVI